MDLDDKVILITGASSGIGAATAIYFSKQLVKLALVGRNEKHLKAISMYCEKYKGIKPLTILGDVNKEPDAVRIVTETINHFGKLDVLINNAGIMGSGGIKDSNLETYDQVMTTNMRAVYHLTMLAVPHLIESKGSIVNVSCIAGTKPSTMALAYNVSKAALDYFTKCIALELAPDGVRVNAVSPSFVKTNLFNKVGLTEDQLAHFVQNVVMNTPLKKPIESDEVAALIAFLTSTNAKNITGCIFAIDGGKLLK